MTEVQQQLLRKLGISEPELVGDLLNAILASHLLNAAKDLIVQANTANSRIINPEYKIDIKGVLENVAN